MILKSAHFQVILILFYRDKKKNLSDIHSVHFAYVESLGTSQITST